MSIKTQSNAQYSNVFYRPELLKVGEEYIKNPHKFAGKYCYIKKYIRKRNIYNISPKEYIKEYYFDTENEAINSLRRKSIIDKIGSENEVRTVQQNNIDIEYSES
jgi:hypothetical protein